MNSHQRFVTKNAKFTNCLLRTRASYATIKVIDSKAIAKHMTMFRRWLRFFLLTLILALTWPAPVQAQIWPLVSGRIPSRDGRWLTPVANPLLSSDEDDHLRRGSVNAWDLSAPLGAPVYPMTAGTVQYAGCNNAGGYGCWAWIRHDGGYSSVYAHMLDEGGGKIWVRTGEKVTAWTVLGRVGWTGRTSFGPHVHWEIRNDRQGQLRNDLFFSRSIVEYCKFCSSNQRGSTTSAIYYTASSYTGALFNQQAVVALLIFGLALVLFLRPEAMVTGFYVVGGVVYRVFNASRASFEAWYGWRRRHWVQLAVTFVVPALLCGATTAFGVWMADSGVAPQAMWAYVRYGLYPLLGGGYQSGAKYSAVWGMPCSGVGTLGQVCTTEEIVAAGVDWQQATEHYALTPPVPVVIPRMSGRFNIQSARALLAAMHAQQGLVIVDVGNDFRYAHRAIDELTAFGLDGVAIDLEYVQNARMRDIRVLAEHMASSRAQAGLKSNGVLVLWNVFHNIETNNGLAVDGVQLVPIFTGYGNTSTKVAGLATTQKLFSVQPADSGLMAFDNRWPINLHCKGFDTQRGFDCQNWYTLFADPVAQQVGWWVQQ